MHHDRRHLPVHIYMIFLYITYTYISIRFLFHFLFHLSPLVIFCPLVFYLSVYLAWYLHLCLSLCPLISIVLSIRSFHSILPSISPFFLWLFCNLSLCRPHLRLLFLFFDNSSIYFLVIFQIFSLLPNHFCSLILTVTLILSFIFAPLSCTLCYPDLLSCGSSVILPFDFRYGGHW